MERIIKFKAKTIIDGAWVEGDIVRMRNNTYIVYTFPDGSGRTLDIVDPSTVCQFTGLKDKNGREVWEHDIIQSPCLKARCEVKWNEFICCISPNGMFVSLGEIINNQGWTVVCSKFDGKEEK